jgi:hypothetical protein
VEEFGTLILAYLGFILFVNAVYVKINIIIEL